MPDLSPRVTAALAELADELKTAQANRASRHDVVLFGSVSMALHGLPREPGDIDMLVSSRTFYRLLALPRWRLHDPDPQHPPIVEAILAGVTVHGFERWRTDDPWIDVGAIRQRSVRRGDWRVAALGEVMVHKVAAIGWTAAVRGGSVLGAAQEKHIADVRLLAEAIGRPFTYDGQEGTTA